MSPLGMTLNWQEAELKLLHLGSIITIHTGPAGWAAFGLLAVYASVFGSSVLVV